MKFSKEEFLSTLGEKVALKPLENEPGRYGGACPFCGADRFSANPERNFYYCFSCRQHGDAIEFMRAFGIGDWRARLRKGEGA